MRVVVVDVLLHLVIDRGSHALGRLVQLASESSVSNHLLLDVVELDHATTARVEVLAAVDLSVLGDENLRKAGSNTATKCAR